MTFSTSSVQPRWVTEMSFNGLMRLNFSRTSVSGTISFSVTTAIRASAGMRFKAKLQPIQPARRAVMESGFRLRYASARRVRLMINYLAAP